MNSYTNLNELMEAWDANEIVQTIEMGGLGPGYEQAIQIGIFETCREFQSADMLKQLQNAADDDAPKGEYSKVLEDALRLSMKRMIPGPLDGLSGAQAGAIKSVVGKYVLQGHATVLDEAREHGVEDNRFIQVRREFPSMA